MKFLGNLKFFNTNYWKVYVYSNLIESQMNSIGLYQKLLVKGFYLLQQIHIYDIITVDKQIKSTLWGNIFFSSSSLFTQINIIISLINSSVSIFRFLSTSLYMYVFFYPKLNNTVYTGFQLYCFSSFISYICSYVDKYPPIRTFLKGFVVFHLWAYHNLLALSPFVKYINCFTFLVIINRAFNDFPCRSLFTFISDYFLMKQSQSWTY